MGGKSLGELEMAGVVEYGKGRSCYALEERTWSRGTDKSTLLVELSEVLPPAHSAGNLRMG